MAYISKQCVTCTDPTKRECGKYCGSDEKGKYSGTLYTCDNGSCKINCGRKRSQKQVTLAEEQKQRAERPAKRKSHLKNI